jgi:hypothetical protein
MPVAVIALLSVYLILWQGYKMRSRVSGFGQLALTGALVFVLSVPVLARLRDARAFGDLDTRWIKLIGGLLVLLACLSLFLFHLSMEEQSIRSPLVARALLGAGAVAVLLTGVVAAAVQQDVPVRVSGQPWVASYFVVGSGYYAYLLYSVAFWMFRTSAGLEKHLKAGLRAAAAGLLLVATQTVSDVPRALVVMLGGPALDFPALPAGIVSAVAAPLVFGGLSYPLLTGRIQAFRRRRQQRSVYTALQPLWDAIVQAYPELVLRRDNDRGRERKRGSSRAEFRYHRRIAECYDGLHRLRSSTPDGASADRREAASALLAAVQLQEQQHPGRLDQWDTTDGEHEVDLLVELAGALENVKQRGLAPAATAGAHADEGTSWRRF